MRVLLVNTSERIGGAAVAANRLMESLKNNGIKAKLLVRDKQTDEISVVGLNKKKSHDLNFLCERFTIWKANHFKKDNLFAVDIADTGTDITKLREYEQADVIHLHWINQGMLSLKVIQKILESHKPVVWTMHDMWPCTGICHHARKCTNYQSECHNCPYLYGDGAKKDLSYRVFHQKKKLYKTAPIVFVACSQWLEQLAHRSALLSGQTVLNIPNPINTMLFRPQNKKEARTKCMLPAHGKLLLFGSVKISDKRKGIDYFVEACKILNEKYPDLKDLLSIVVFGNQSQLLENALPFRVYPLNFINNDRDLVNIYNAVDLYVTPSLEENLPNTIMESMACGVPCVGFNIGGIPEMIDHRENGYVAEYKSADDFANGIHWILSEADYPKISEKACHKAVTNYSEGTVAKQYIQIYNKITGKNA